MARARVRIARRGAGLVTLLVVLVVASALPAVADPKWDGNGDELTGTDGGGSSGGSSGGTGGGTGGGGGEVITIPKPYKEYRYIPACSANDVEGGADALCGQAVYSCPREGDIRYRVYTRQHDADGSVAEGADWELLPETQCRGPRDAPEGGPIVITTEDIADEARKRAPATTVHVEPGVRSYVNVPNNFYADDAPQDASIELLGQTIALRFQPTGFAWTFGDGTSGTGAGVPNAAVGQPGAVEHAYRRSGSVAITLTRTFGVTYTLPGGRTGTLPGPGLTNTSAPYVLDIGEIQSLVTKVR